MVPRKPVVDLHVVYHCLLGLFIDFFKCSIDRSAATQVTYGEYWEYYRFKNNYPTLFGTQHLLDDEADCN